MEDKEITGPIAMKVMSRKEYQNRRLFRAETVPLRSSTLSEGLSARTMEAWGAAPLSSWKGPQIHPFDQLYCLLFRKEKRLAYQRPPVQRVCSCLSGHKCPTQAVSFEHRRPFQGVQQAAWFLRIPASWRANTPPNSIREPPEYTRP